MTRFFVKIGCQDIIKRLIKYCEKENYAYRVNEFGVVSSRVLVILKSSAMMKHIETTMTISFQLTISTTDRRKMSLVFKVNFIEMDGNVLVDFRLSKGCGLEFKRAFIKIRYTVEDIIVKSSTVYSKA